MAEYFRELNVEAWGDRVRDAAEDALRDVVRDARDQVVEIIYAAETSWGRERVAGLHGEPRTSAGRVETGEMVSEVDYSISIDDDVMEGRWGWSDPKDYYLIQEHGFKEFDTNIVPMESLATSIARAEDELHGRLARIAGS